MPPGSPVYAAHIRVRGLVQGVSFRASLARVASEHGVKGWVKNTPDGSVEAHVEGDKEAVLQVLGWARRGPPRARVDRIDMASVEPREYHGFRITN